MPVLFVVVYSIGNPHKKNFKPFLKTLHFDSVLNFKLAKHYLQDKVDFVFQNQIVYPARCVPNADISSLEGKLESVSYRMKLAASHPSLVYEVFRKRLETFSRNFQQHIHWITGPLELSFNKEEITIYT